MWTRETIWYNSDLVEGVTNDWFDPDFWRRQQQLTGEAPGRGTTYFFHHQNMELVLRRYKRGGLPGKILEDQYWFQGISRTRAWREINLLLQMEELCLPIPKAVAARVRRTGWYYKSDIITARIPGAVDTHHMLCERQLSDEVWQDIGKTIARFHSFQVYHHDLNIHNIMLDTDDKVWLIDFDKCRIRKTHHWKKGNLERLLRSLNKEKSKLPSYHFSEENWHKLLEGYQNATGT